MTSINTNFETFGDIIEMTLNCHMPFKTINVNKIRPSRPWLYPSLCKCISKSKKLFAKTLHKNSSDLDHLTYKNYHNVLNRVKQKAMTTYFSEKCVEFKQNGKKLWGIIRKIVQKQNDKSSIIECLEINKIQCFESKLIADEFGKFFLTVGKQYAKKISNPVIPSKEYLSKMPRNTKSIYFTPVTKSEIMKIIDRLHNKNSHGHDGLSNKLIKSIKTALCKPLCILFNTSLESGIFPELYKKSDVVPLFKSKNKINVTNYHAISLLPVISKVLEKLYIVEHIIFWTQMIKYSLVNMGSILDILVKMQLVSWPPKYQKEGTIIKTP